MVAPEVSPIQRQQHSQGILHPPSTTQPSHRDRLKKLQEQLEEETNKLQLLKDTIGRKTKDLKVRQSSLVKAREEWKQEARGVEKVTALFGFDLT